MSVVGIQSAPTAARTPSEPASESSEAAGRKTLKIEVTPTAIAHIAKLWQKRVAEGKTPTGLRIGLRGGGCDGFSYVFEWSDQPAHARDHVLQFTAEGGTEIRVFVDPKSMLYLAGTSLTFVTGMMGHGFKFENPNVKGACGCGESVHF